VPPNPVAKSEPSAINEEDPGEGIEGDSIEMNDEEIINPEENISLAENIEKEEVSLGHEGDFFSASRNNNDEPVVSSGQ
jgi:hypothetical protein